MTPPFMPGNTNYVVQVDASIPVLTLTFQKASPLSTVAISLDYGPFITKDQSFHIVELQAEETVVRLMVGLENPLVSKQYQFLIKKVTNQSPYADSLQVSGTLEVGSKLTAIYTYGDAETDSEGDSLYQWFQADDATGTNATEIEGANQRDYLLRSGDKEKFFAFHVTPIALTGTLQGVPVQSAFAGPIQNAPPPPLPPTTVSNTTVLINGETAESGFSMTTNVVDDQKFVNISAKPGPISKWFDVPTQSTLTLTTSDGASGLSGTFFMDTFKTLANKGTLLNLDAGFASYSLPTNQVNLNMIQSIFGEKLGQPVLEQDIQMKIVMEREQRSLLLTALKHHFGEKLIVSPVSYKIEFSFSNYSLDSDAQSYHLLYQLGVFKGYVERSVTLPDLLPTAGVTTGIVLNQDGSFTHIPTKVMNIGGNQVAIMNSLTNSVYAVVTNEKSFSDIQTHWAKASIENMASRFIINGKSEQHFDPSNVVTRAEFASMLVRALGLSAYQKKSAYTDVEEGKWYYDAIQIASEFGLIRGYPDGGFHPNGKITREEASVVMSRALTWTKLTPTLAKEGIDSQLAAYKDQTKIANYARMAMGLMTTHGVIGGYQGFSKPKANISRAETAAIIERFLKQAGFI